MRTLAIVLFVWAFFNILVVVFSYWRLLAGFQDGSTLFLIVVNLISAILSTLAGFILLRRG